MNGFTEIGELYESLSQLFPDLVRCITSLNDLSLLGKSYRGVSDSVNYSYKFSRLLYKHVKIKIETFNFTHCFVWV
jgi:hypothetical protein